MYIESVKVWATPRAKIYFSTCGSDNFQKPVVPAVTIGIDAIHSVCTTFAQTKRFGLTLLSPFPDTKTLPDGS